MKVGNESYEGVQGNFDILIVDVAIFLLHIIHYGVWIRIILLCLLDMKGDSKCNNGRGT